MFDTILQALYVFLPAMIANMCPVIFKWVPFADRPISRKWLGDHKTYRGFIVGYMGALGVLYIQSKFTTSYDILNYQSINLYLYAAIFGGGAITGDAAKSFFKRRLKIPPGAPFIPFDQIDFILGATLFLIPFFALESKILLVALLVIPILHFLSNIVGYWIGLKKVWW